MDIGNVILHENSTLKPIPPKIVHCKTCKSNFTSYLKINAEFYKSCDECRHNTRLQNRCLRSTYKHSLLN